MRGAPLGGRAVKIKRSPAAPSLPLARAEVMPLRRADKKTLGRRLSL